MWSYQGERTWGLFLEHDIYSKLDTEMWGARRAEEEQDGYSTGNQQEAPFYKFQKRLSKRPQARWAALSCPRSVEQPKAGGTASLLQTGDGTAPAHCHLLEMLLLRSVICLLFKEVAGWLRQWST